MTPAQQKQIGDCVTRIRNMRSGGVRDEFISAGLISEGYAAAAVDAAFEQIREKE